MEKSPRPLSGQETSVPSQVESNSDNDSLNPVGNITPGDREMLRAKGISPEEYEEMWALPARIKVTKQEVEAEYDE